MNFTTDATSLSDALRVVLRVVGTSSNPVLSGVHLVAEDGRVRLTGTDLTTTLEVTVPAEIVEPGSLLLPGKLLGSLLARTSGTASLAATAAGATLSVAGVTTNLRALDPLAFPEPAERPAPTVVVDAESFAAQVRAVTAAVSTDPNRGVLTGLLMELQDSHLILTATDTYRLITDSRPVESAAQFSAVVPVSALTATAKVAGEVAISVTDAEIWLHAGEMTVRSRLLAGAYPDWRSLLIYTDADPTLTLPSADVVELLARVAPSVGSNRVVEFALVDSEITLTTRGDLGSSSGAVAAPAADHDLTFSVRLDYLDDALRLVGETAVLTHREPSRPLMLASPETTVRCLLMPIRTP